MSTAPLDTIIRVFCQTGQKLLIPCGGAIDTPVCRCWKNSRIDLTFKLFLPLSQASFGGVIQAHLIGSFSQVEIMQVILVEQWFVTVVWKFYMYLTFRQNDDYLGNCWGIKNWKFL